jgi:hypothetical protein
MSLKEDIDVSNLSHNIGHVKASWKAPIFLLSFHVKFKQSKCWISESSGRRLRQQGKSAGFNKAPDGTCPKTGKVPESEERARSLGAFGIS